MNILQRIGEAIMNLFKQDAQKIFDVDAISSNEMAEAQDLWNKIIKNTPPWISDSVRSIGFGKFIAQYTSKKVCQDIALNIEGSDRANFINDIVMAMTNKVLRDKVEDAVGIGGIILKPNGNNNVSNAIDYVMPWNYVITEQTSNGDILGIVFFDRITRGNVYYTRLEYQHFVEGITEDGLEGRFYQIENKAFKSNSESHLGTEITLESVPEWRLIQPVSTANNIEKALFGYLKMPSNNTIDYRSPEGVSIFANCIEELKDLDIAWSLKGNEVEDSQHMTFIDEVALTKRGANGREQRVKLPRFVKGLRMGVDSNSTIQEHVPTLLTEQRIADINATLSLISTKCGFSQGQFILDRKTGRLTATQIESDDSETVETINEIRKALKDAIKDLVYALDKYCDLIYNLPSGYVNVLDDNVPDEDIFYFKDLMASFEQDRQRAYQLMNLGKYSTKKYLMEYEGFKEKEVDEMMEEIKKEQSAQDGLFSEE